MAKSNSFFGLRRGSTKTLTFQVNNGQQITKDRVEIVKNPRTQSQMTQRMIMATASAAYTAMKQICNHSFEGVSYGQGSMSKFIAVNAKLLRKNLSRTNTQFGYNEYRDRAVKMGRYQISDGSLPALPLHGNVNFSSSAVAVNWEEVGLAQQYTANQLAALFGISLNEMATICLLFENADENALNFGFIRIKFIKEGDVTLTTANVGEYFTFESNLGAVSATVSAAAFRLSLEGIDCEETSNFGQAVIYSRFSASGWLRSKAVLSLDGGMEIVPTSEAALATYPVGTDYVLNGGEVNS